MDAIVFIFLLWGLCIEGLWRGWRFAMIGMKKLQDIFEEGYILSSNGNASVLLTFKIFGWFCYSRCHRVQFNT